jgi:PleD family two-component response regulator
MVQHQQFNIAMIDDDSDEADFIEDAISDSNLPIQFRYFSSFEQFMEAAPQSFLPDLIIMDINLPCKNGIECIKELKAHTTLSYIPVVTFSNSHCQKYEDDSKQAGALQLFLKPTTISEYRQVVDAFYEICLKNSASQFEEQAVA